METQCRYGEKQGMDVGASEKSCLRREAIERRQPISTVLINCRFVEEPCFLDLGRNISGC